MACIKVHREANSYQELNIYSFPPVSFLVKILKKFKSHHCKRVILSTQDSHTYVCFGIRWCFHFKSLSANLSNLSQLFNGTFHRVLPKLSAVIVFTHDVQREISCTGCISETFRCRILILNRDIGSGCRYATSWCDFDLTVDLEFSDLFGLYLRNRKL